MLTIEQIAELRRLLNAAHGLAYLMPMNAQTDDLLSIIQDAIDLFDSDPDDLLSDEQRREAWPIAAPARPHTLTELDEMYGEIPF